MEALILLVIIGVGVYLLSRRKVTTFPVVISRLPDFEASFTSTDLENIYKAADSVGMDHTLAAKYVAKWKAIGYDLAIARVMVPPEERDMVEKFWALIRIKES